jgi:dihydroflavonol-4-reductase
MLVLVTGSTGFIGSNICRALVGEGHSVRAFHRPNSSLLGLERLPVEHCLGDLTQPASVTAAMDGVDAVFHTAALLSGGVEAAGRMYAVNVEGTRTVMNAARQLGVRRVVHTSSSAALGVPEQNISRKLDPVKINENHTWNLPPDAWAYGYSKYLAENEVQKAVAQGLDAVIVNPTHIIGPGDLYRQISSVVVSSALRKIPFTVPGGLNIVHIADVVAGHLSALERGRRGERYLLGGENITLTGLVQKCCAQAGVAPPGLVIPAFLVRPFTRPLKLMRSYIELPVPPELLRFSGIYFYYDNAKTLRELELPEPLPAGEAIRAAYEWFVSVGAIK